MKRLVAVSLVALAACAQPAVVSNGASRSTVATSPSLPSSPPFSPDSSMPSSTSSIPGSSTTTTPHPEPGVQFPEIELIDPPSGVDASGEFDFVNVAGVIAYRVTVAYEHPEGVAYRVSSDTDGRVTWHRVEGATCGQVTECSAEGVEDGEWIITPAGVWTFVAGDWVNLDPSDPGTGWAMALAPWQLSEPRTIYGQVYEVFAELEPQRWIEVEGGEAIVYSGGADTVAHFFGEDAGDVESGRLEVWMDPTGFPLRVIADTTEVRDLSLPAMYDWSLSDLGAIDIELPDEIFAATAGSMPILVWVETDSCASLDPDSQTCETLAQVFGDGRWEIRTTGRDPQSGTLSSSALDPLWTVLDNIDFAQLGTLVSNGKCSANAWLDQKTIVLFPALPAAETFASCTSPYDPEQSPYREALELIALLPVE